MFKRLPQGQQIAVLQQASADEVKSCWPHASMKQRGNGFGSTGGCSPPGREHLPHPRRTKARALLAELHDALNAWPSALRRNDDGLWTLRGRPGCYAATWGDGRSWQLVVTPDEMITKKQWTAHKKQLSFGEVTQDGDQEGVFRICDLLPTAAEAEMIRDILGIRKRVELSPGQLENLRRWSFEKGAPKGK
jgi:hypothetical protein